MFDLAAESHKTNLYFPKKVDDHEDSGVCSPPLWRTSLSPESRAQAISRGQKELMEMVSRMPESSYELSLKDLVEANVNHDEGKVLDERPQRREKEFRKTMSDKRLQINRNGSINNDGFLLKMVFPFSLGSKKKKKKKTMKDDTSSIGSCSRVSPRPSVSNVPARIDDTEWWKNVVTEAGESDSGVSSLNSGSMKSSGSSSGGSTRRRPSFREPSGGCWSFLRNLRRGIKRS